MKKEVIWHFCAIASFRAALIFPNVRALSPSPKNFNQLVLILFSLKYMIKLGLDLFRDPIQDYSWFVK